MSLVQRNDSLSAELLAHTHVVLLPYNCVKLPPCGAGSLSMLGEQYRRAALTRVESILDDGFTSQPWRSGLAVGSDDARLLTLLGERDVRLFDAHQRVFVLV